MIPDNDCHRKPAVGVQEVTIALHRRGLTVSITIAQNQPVPMHKRCHATGNALRKRNTRARVRDRFSAFNKDTERNTSA